MLLNVVISSTTFTFNAHSSPTNVAQKGLPRSMQGAAMHYERGLRLCTGAVSGTAVPRCRACISHFAGVSIILVPLFLANRHFFQHLEILRFDVTDDCGGCRMENSRQLEAAKALLQTVEELFPNKQQRASVAHEYETAVTARHQEHKNPERPPGTFLLSAPATIALLLCSCYLPSSSVVR